jgi:hypothetical protein
LPCRNKQENAEEGNNTQPALASASRRAAKRQLYLAVRIAHQNHAKLESGDGIWSDGPTIAKAIVSCR